MVVPGGVDPRALLSDPGAFNESDIARLGNAVKSLSQQSNVYTRTEPGTGVVAGIGRVRSPGNPYDPRRGTSVPQITQSVPGAPTGWAQASSGGETSDGANLPGSQASERGRNILASLGVEEAPPVDRPRAGEGSAEPVSVKRGFGSGGMFAQPANRDADAGYKEQMLTAEMQRTAAEGEKPPFDPAQRKGVVEAMEQRALGRTRSGVSESTYKRKAKDLRARAQRVTPGDVAYLQSVEDQLRADRGEPGRAADIEVIPPELQAILDEYAEQIPRDVPNPTDPLDPRRTRVVNDQNSGQNSRSGLSGDETWTDSTRETVPAMIEVPIRGNDGQLVKITVDSLRAAGYDDDQIAQSGRVGTYATRMVSTDSINQNDPVLNPDSGLFNDATFISANEDQVSIGRAARDMRAEGRTRMVGEETIDRLRDEGAFQGDSDPNRSSYRGTIDEGERESLSLPGSGPIKVYANGDNYRLDRDVPYDYDRIRDSVNPDPASVDSEGRPIQQVQPGNEAYRSQYDGIDGLTTRVVTTGAQFYVDENGVRRQKPGTGRQVEVGPTPFMNRPDAIDDRAIAGKTNTDGSPKTKEQYLAAIRKNNERSVGAKTIYDGRTRQKIENPMYESSKRITGSPEGVIKELAAASGSGSRSDSTAIAREDLARMIVDGALTKNGTPITIDDLGTNTSRPDSVAREDLELAIQELDNQMARASGQRNDGIGRVYQPTQEEVLAAAMASGEVNGADLAAGWRDGSQRSASAPVEALFEAESYGTTPGKALWAAGNIDGSGRTVSSKYQVNDASIADTSAADRMESNYNNTDDFETVGQYANPDLSSYSIATDLSPEEQTGRMIAADAYANMTGLDQYASDPRMAEQVESQLGTYQKGSVVDLIYSDAARTAHGVPGAAQIRTSAAKFVGDVTAQGGRFSGSAGPVTFEAEYREKGAIADAAAPVQQATSQGVTNTENFSQINAPAPQPVEVAGYNNRYGRGPRR